MLGPHALYTCPPEYLKKVTDAANKLNAEIHIHMSETEVEVNDCLKNYGKRPFAHVESTGLFENGTLAAHCVHVDDEDIAIMKKHNIRVAHNPGSNLKLASGIAPAAKLLDEGVTVALGTDGASSNNNLDMLEEMRLAALVAKVEANDPKAVPALTALKMGTEYGAKSLNLDKVGKIEAGYKADIVLYDTTKAHWHPNFNPISLLIYSANSADTDAVIVDGKVLMENKTLATIDEEKVYFEVDKCVKRLIG
jgi:5-methylthioadenosine/S-adenosylhomocysteine deaminase